MEGNQKENVKNSVGRAIFAALSILLQVGWIVGLMMTLNEYYAAISLLTTVVALVAVLRLFGRQLNGAARTSWIIVIAFFPVAGLCLYILVGQPGSVGPMRKRFENIHSKVENLLPPDQTVLPALEQQDLAIANQVRYLTNVAGYPGYHNTQVEYYPRAEDAIQAQKEALRRAKHFIFMEYHAIQDAQSFRELEEILAERAANGVEVRLFYDDMGSIGFISPAFIRRMQAKGIQCRVFNPLIPVLNVFMNNRDHRKITVVDGQVGFTGGYNLADEYFNITHPFGHWKDTGVKLTGDAVRSLSVMFLEMWNAMQVSDQDYEQYLPLVQPAPRDGVVVPYADSPLDDERVGENVYLNLVKNAKRYVYIMTPYLILDDETVLELTLAAKRGVDVRIITPGIPDKKLIYQVTRSYYAHLAQAGVHIYEYTPGFCHAKMMLCDDEAATVGTINLDYRSLYHHFENGVYLYRCRAVAQIRADFDQTLGQCADVTDQYRSRRSTALRIGQCLLRVAAPLL